MNFEEVKKEVQFKMNRSSGPGGQHVNKVASKVSLIFDLPNSKALNEEEKTRLYQNLSSKLTKEKCLMLHCDQFRSQHRNKERVLERLFDVLTVGLKVPKKRKNTKPTGSSVRRRLDTKKKVAQKKKNRQKPNLN